ncbi:hypothetical protein Leryth_010647 [Lithospermum erythrorhizon]|nr:hypothetical protein Leryth_010647 [Lithospermum erythrorhizon]
MEPALSPSLRRRDSGGGGGTSSREQEDVVICSSSSTPKRKSGFIGKSKSRLLDIPEQEGKRSQNLRSGALKKINETNEDDPFLEDDLPKEYKKIKFNKITVFQFLSLILIIALLVFTLTIKVWKEKHLLSLELWKWEVMVLVLISGRLLSGWLIRVVVFFIERNCLWRRRVLYFVYGLRNAVQNCIWLTLALIAWLCFFYKKMDELTHHKALPYVTRIWVCLVVGTFIWLLKTLVVKVLAMSFHVSTFFDRIQGSLFNQYVIETLSNPPSIVAQQEHEEEDRVLSEIQKFENAEVHLPEDLKANVLPKVAQEKNPSAANAKSPLVSRIMSKKQQEKADITVGNLHRLNQENISAWNMNKMVHMVRQGMLLSTLDERLQESGGEDESTVEIMNESQAKAAAKNIFYNVANTGSKCIYLEDLKKFMSNDDAVNTLDHIEGANETTGISKKALKNWVVTVFKERRALALSLDDTNTAVKKLHHMLNVLVAIVILIIWLLMLKVATSKFFILFSSQILLIVFVFGNTCKTTFEAIIFLFVMHPFDVGDRVEVDGVQMIVDEMNMLTTVFLRYDFQKITYPNSILATKPIGNYNRSPNMRDEVNFSIHISTPVEKISKMKEKITSYIEGKSEHWHSKSKIFVKNVEDMNFQDMGERYLRRGLLVEGMINIFRELHIEYRMLPHDVNIRPMPPLSSTRLPSNWMTFAQE